MNPKVDWGSPDAQWASVFAAVLVLLGVGILVALILNSDYEIPNTIPESYVKVDPLTGCEYLNFNGLTPRLDRNGKQICQAVETGE
jgi:hypothetical protein